MDLELEQRQALGFAHSICTDCVSMVTMRQQGITNVLTCDVHFVWSAKSFCKLTRMITRQSW